MTKEKAEELNASLQKIIASLQKMILNRDLRKDAILRATGELAALHYNYDEDSSPPLVGTESFSNDSADAPQDLAEALLWKLGKWKAYKKFCNNYASEKSEPTNTDVVFWAFAQHLKNKENPIYDQHAIRSLWAICGNLTAEDKKKCKSLLFCRNGKWKQSGTGKNSIECYNFFVKYVKKLVEESQGASMSELDRLLMPLGQAIKEATKTYAEFEILCSWHTGG